MGLVEILDACRKYGVKTLKYRHIDIEFGPDPNQPVFIQEPLTQKIGAARGAPTEDELMFWSADKDLPEIESEPPQ